jgi:hypothetical protein
MDPLNETTYVPLLVNLLFWIKVLEVCAIILVTLYLVTLVVAWKLQLSRRVRATALVPLAAGIGAGVAVYVLHTTYAYWNAQLVTAYTVDPGVPGHGLPLGWTFRHVHVVIIGLGPEIPNATHTAMVLGWAAIVVTGILLVLGLVGAWQLFAAGRHS